MDPGENAVISKLESITLHGTLEFHSTPLSDALEYLEQESRRLDTAEPDETQRGVSVWLVDARASQPCTIPGLPPLPPEVPRVTLALRNAPLGNAIAAVAAAALMRSTLDGAGVLIVPLEPMEQSAGAPVPAGLSVVGEMADGSPIPAGAPDPMEEARARFSAVQAELQARFPAVFAEGSAEQKRFLKAWREIAGNDIDEAVAVAELVFL